MEFAICTKNMELLKLYSKETAIFIFIYLFFFFAKSSWYLLRSDV